MKQSNVKNNAWGSDYIPTFVVVKLSLRIWRERNRKSPLFRVTFVSHGIISFLFLPKEFKVSGKMKNSHLTVFLCLRQDLLGVLFPASWMCIEESRCQEVPRRTLMTFLEAARVA